MIYLIILVLQKKKSIRKNSNAYIDVNEVNLDKIIKLNEIKF